jgi:carboxyl-terminal processing protease
MNRNTLIIVIVAALALIGAACVCLGAAGIMFFQLADDPITDFLDESPIQLGDEPVETIQQTQTPIESAVDLGQLFQPVWESRLLLKDNYVDQPVQDSALGEGALTGLTEALAELGVDLADAEIPDSAPSAAALADEAGTPDEAVADFEAFWDAWRALPYLPYEDPSAVSYERLMQASLRGLVAGLGDAHTGYLDPFQVQQADLSLAGEYEGIGAWVDPTSEYLTIVAPMEDSPAEAAGILAGDRVIAVDGQDMTGVDGNVVISYILGPAGTDVTLTIERDDEPEPFDVTVTRAQIVVKSVTGEILEDNIGYVQLQTFGADTAHELSVVLEDLLAEDPIGIILDLRNNGGGYLNTAVQVVSEFIDGGVALHEEFGDGSTQTYDLQGDGLAIDIPLIILVNGGTASASEIVAGAVQDYDRGILVGVTTFGKGSVQIGQDLSNGQGSLRITIARWLTPDRRQIHGVGLEPDVVVEMTEDDINADLDPQLDAAIQLMLDQ